MCPPDACGWRSSWRATRRTPRLDIVATAAAYDDLCGWCTPTTNIRAVAAEHRCCTRIVRRYDRSCNPCTSRLSGVHATTAAAQMVWSVDTRRSATWLRPPTRAVAEQCFFVTTTARWEPRVAQHGATRMTIWTSTPPLLRGCSSCSMRPSCSRSACTSHRHRSLVPVRS